MVLQFMTRESLSRCGFTSSAFPSDTDPLNPLETASMPKSFLDVAHCFISNELSERFILDLKVNYILFRNTFKK